MKKIFLIVLLTLFFSGEYFSQSQFAGIWQGPLQFNNVELRIVFRITDHGDSLSALLDSPDQGAKDIPVNSVAATDSSIRLNVNIINGYYEGTYRGDSIDGKWVQGGMTLPLVLKKIDMIEEVKRPQNPVPPYPYNEEEVSFENKNAGITLAGTFTYPKEGNNFPAVVLISGSGMQDRDESLLNHKPFLVLSDYLTRNGIAVLRYDDRGAGKSTGDFLSATSMDFVSDALSAVNFLLTRKEVDKDKIGLVGHSEGGLIAPIASNKNKDIDFIVLMAGPGLKGDKLLLLQEALISRAEGETEENIKKNTATAKRIYELIDSEKDTAVLRSKVVEILKESFSSMTEEDRKKIPDIDAIINQQVSQILTPWFRFFITYDPYPELKKVDVPLLAINGENDLQVPPRENLDLIEKAMQDGGNKNYKTVLVPGLNHLFQTSETGKVSEYNKIEETFSPAAMKIISEWILQITSGK
jgi:uncharacterized protein